MTKLFNLYWIWCKFIKLENSKKSIYSSNGTWKTCLNFQYIENIFFLLGAFTVIRLLPLRHRLYVLGCLICLKRCLICLRLAAMVTWICILVYKGGIPSGGRPQQNNVLQSIYQTMASWFSKWSVQHQQNPTRRHNMNLWKSAKGTAGSGRPCPACR